jgi:hypothetical protein
MRYSLLILAPLLLASAGCSPETRQSYQSAPAAGDFELRGGMLEGSLFPADTQALSNEAVDRILSGKLERREEGRLAVLPIGNWNYYETGEMGRYLDTIATTISPSPLVGEVVQIPRVLMPRQVTVPVLREVGARLQCEYVLVYNISIDMHYQANLFSKDESRNRVTVEAIVLQVRTGVIPVTVIQDQIIDFTQTKGEDSYEFIRRLQRETALKALQGAADKIVAKLQ